MKFIPAIVAVCVLTLMITQAKGTSVDEQLPILEQVGANKTNPLKILWSLPVDILYVEGLNEEESVPLLAQDTDTIYVANTSNYILAYRAIDGEFLWAHQAHNLTKIFTVGQHPEYVYFVYHPGITWNQISALRKADGKLMGNVKRNFDCGSLCQHRVVESTKYGLILPHREGVLAMDASLQETLWDHPFKRAFYSSIAANDELVVSIQHLDNHDYDVQLVSFDAKTGDVVCTLPNITTEHPFAQLPLVITKDNIVYAQDSPPGSYYHPKVYARVLDVMNCFVERTAVFNNETFMNTTKAMAPSAEGS